MLFENFGLVVEVFVLGLWFVFLSYHFPRLLMIKIMKMDVKSLTVSLLMMLMGGISLYLYTHFGGSFSSLLFYEELVSDEFWFMSFLSLLAGSIVLVAGLFLEAVSSD